MKIGRRSCRMGAILAIYENYSAYENCSAILQALDEIKDNSSNACVACGLRQVWIFSGAEKILSWKIKHSLLGVKNENILRESLEIGDWILGFSFELD